MLHITVFITFLFTLLSVFLGAERKNMRHVAHNLRGTQDWVSQQCCWRFTLFYMCNSLCLERSYCLDLESQVQSFETVGTTHTTVYILEDLNLYTRTLDHADHVLYTNVQWLTGAVVCRHHTRKILSMLPAANSVFSVFTAMSVISADAPRSVANRRPSITLHILTRRSSAPCREGSNMSLTFLGAINTITYY